MELQHQTYKFCTECYSQLGKNSWPSSTLGFQNICLLQTLPSEKCTVHLILSNCPTALKQKRYKWRHDSVLYHIKAALTLHISSQSKHLISQNKTRHISQSFVKAGSTLSALCRKKAQKKNRQTELDGATDWTILTDFDQDKYVFPPEILSTNLRPDILIWSQNQHKVIMIELICPAEEGMSAAQTLKESRYLPLITDIKNTRKWTVKFFTIEVGARGFVNNFSGNAVWHLECQEQQQWNSVKLFHEL